MSRSGGRITAGRRVFGLALVLIALLGSCRDSPHARPVCTMIFVYGLSVEVLDALSGAGIASGAVAVARDGNYLETLEHGPVDSVALHGAGERAGTYTITVTRPGYAAWSSPPVTVTADECHVRLVAVTARLTPAP
jgi:hypothetical protein